MKNKNYFILVLSFVFLIFLYFANGNRYYPFKYIETDNFYSYIIIEDAKSKKWSSVVPFGVFGVGEEDGWIHVARMNVYIIDCPLYKGLQHEGTVYDKTQEYWLLNKVDKSVYGPMNCLNMSSL